MTKIKIIIKAGEMEQVLEVETEEQYVSDKIRLLETCFDLINGDPVLQIMDTEEEN